MPKKFEVGQIVWFKTPLSGRIYYGRIESISQNGIYTVRSNGYGRFLEENRIFASKEELLKHEENESE